MTNDNDIDSLLAKYLAEEADQQEESFVEEWLEESDEHQQIWTQSKQIWEGSACLQGQQKVDVDCAWSKVRTCIFDKKKPELSQEDSSNVIIALPKRKVFAFNTVARIAASIVLLIGVLFISYQYLKTSSIASDSTIVQLTSNQQIIEKTLPDGTRIRLTKNSKLSYPTTFEGTTREVTLEGEAFFDVHHNEQQPFIVHTQQTDIRVLGTSFHVVANKEGVHLAVKTGRVQFSNAKERVILVENEEASFLVSENSIHKTSATTSVRRNFVFEHTPLEEVLAQLSQAFDMTISLESSNLGNAELSADFENEKIENIVSIIETTFCLTSKKTENGYLLLGKGCK